ncbi:MAG: phenylalanine--tRNA ligase subunit beta [Desulfobacteraceae bacterium 4572_88]|nr:MAG: phenylalanine--tRNA ligase subunit beta [Desulfobacteraceae bacterium 4572_88]
MKVSLSWLRDYVPIEMAVNDLADALTMVGLEVEVVSDRYAYLDTVKVARVVSVRPHPNADKLKICDVDTGAGQVAVVCGAPNVSEGMLAPLATPGTVFPDGSVLQKSVIRGEASEGMLCSEAELVLGSDKSGIMSLDPGLTAGEPLAKALGLSDAMFEIGLTPNRPDCLSVIGIAREVAAIQGTHVKYPDSSLPEPSPGTEHISEMSSVTIESPDHCPRYAARLLEGVAVGPSPFWLRDRLMSVELRPINNLVDITNFVMMETGQPLHAFDFDQLAEHRIVVRTAEEGEPFTTLDEKERKLSSHMLMICDGEKPVAVGGVMGGLNSEIEDSTTKVLIESAYFSPTSIRKTSKKLGLNTDASHRFERGVDPRGTVMALDRAAQLMAELGGGKLAEGLIDEHPRPSSEKTISLSASDTNRVLGTSLDQEEMARLLTSVEFTVEKADEDTLNVTLPSYRVDVFRPEDLMEEVARLSGYQNIPITFPALPSEARTLSRPLAMRDRMRRMMIGFGFTEAINYSFMSRESCDRLRLGTDDSRRKMLDILNPLTEDQAVMRTSLIPGMIETMHRNIARQNKNLRLFEVGQTFVSKGQTVQPDETEMFVGLWTGTRGDASWHSKETACDFYDIKGLVQGLLEGLRIQDVKFTRIQENAFPYMKPGYTAQIFIPPAQGDEAKVLGQVGEIHPEVLRNFDLEQAAFVFELNMAVISPLIPDTKQFRKIPKYPAVPRDITLIVDQHVEAEEILARVRNTGEVLVEDLHLFDVYEGSPIPEGHKSISFRIIYRSLHETLEDETVSRIHKNITDGLVASFNATLPA